MNPQIIFRNCIRLPLLLIMGMFAVSANANADVVVIVSAKSPVTRLTAEQAAKIFLGKVDSFPNDGVALPIDQAEGSTVRDEFYAKVVRKSSSQLTAYWAKIIFTGDGHPPIRLEGDVAVRNAIANNQNAIGYIDKNAVDSSVRVVLAP
jgi:ABC-type phosphate transport system substrate-binding protein